MAAAARGGEREEGVCVDLLFWQQPVRRCELAQRGYQWLAGNPVGRCRAWRRARERGYAVREGTSMRTPGAHNKAPNSPEKGVVPGHQQQRGRADVRQVVGRARVAVVWSLCVCVGGGSFERMSVPTVEKLPRVAVVCVLCGVVANVSANMKRAHLSHRVRYQGGPALREAATASSS